MRCTIRSEIGLSPLARGTRRTDWLRHLKHRFIPAGAGNSHSQSSTDSGAAVYPRRRGELIAGYPRPVTQNGLSPQARGTHMPGLNRLNMLRFIPAGAGNSCAKAGRLRVLPVYPRRRGELKPWRGSPLASTGLSPQARGTRETKHEKINNIRFIPAGAGNSQGFLIDDMQIPVYPRRRGELTGAGGAA